MIWSDGDCNSHAELVDGRRLKSNKIAHLKPGQWAIVDAVQEEKVCANALLATDDYLMYKCFSMEVNGYEEEDELKDLGPFTVTQAKTREDWPMFEEAIFEEFFGHQKLGIFKLEDEEYVYNQGDPLYETRLVLSRKRKGAYKARMVLRGDFQVFKEPDDYDYNYENEWLSEDAKRDTEWAEVGTQISCETICKCLRRRRR